MNYTALTRTMTLATAGVFLAAGFATPASAASKKLVPEQLPVSKVLQDVTLHNRDKDSAKQKQDNAGPSIISDTSMAVDASDQQRVASDSQTSQSQQSVNAAGENVSAGSVQAAPAPQSSSAIASSSELAIASPIAAPILTSEKTPPSAPVRATVPTPASISADVTKATTNTLASLFAGKAIDESSGSPYADTLALSVMQTMYLLALAFALALTGVALGEPEFLAFAYAVAAEMVRTGRLSIGQSGVRA